MKMYHKGKVVKRQGPESGRAPTDFFGHGQEIRATLTQRLPRRAVQALDVGTGFGRNAVFLAQRLSGKSHICSVDPSQESLKRGAATLEENDLSSRVCLVCGWAERLPFEDGVFQLIMGVMLFHHLVAIPPVLRELARVMTPNGSLLLVDWAPTAHLLPFAVEHRAEDFFTPHAVERMLIEAGFLPAVEHHPLWYFIEAQKA
jgi:ubiquinone/menaquinone biosynthesis C-methylase UbiE